MPDGEASMPMGAVRAELPATLEPELATLVDRPRPGDWLYEIKFDGYRMLARIGGPKDVRILTRNGNDWTAQLPSLRKELEAAKLPPGWYDGEIVMLDTDGVPNFNALQNAIKGGKNDQIVMYLFDAPFVSGFDLRGVSVEERRAVLSRSFNETDRLRFSQEIEAAVRDLIATACNMGLEGVIGKRRGSYYVHGRSDDWIKLKCTQRQEFVIGGYVWPGKDRMGPGIGALLVGYFDPTGDLQYAGKVGTGFTGETSADLRRRLDAIQQPKRPFAGRTGHDHESTWARPEIVCEVAYSEWPQKLHLRHASFKGLREDKTAASIGRERPAAVAPAKAAPPKISVAKGKLKVTHGDRIIDASTGLTKLDLVTYYAQVAKWALPHLKGRPVYIRRAPKGIDHPMVFQQHTLDMRGLKSMDPKLWPGHKPAISIETPEDLVLAAQFDAVELHTWNSTARAITQPDRIVFDLDPGEGVPWTETQRAALLVRAMLKELGLESWLKTTGGKGLHVFVPLQPELGYAEVKTFSESVVVHLAKTLPKIFVSKSGPRNRIGLIFIDYLRNGWAQSTAEAYSARARPGLGVSMPVAWDHLQRVRGGSDWTIANAIEHLASVKRDPWAGYWKSKHRLGPAIEALRD